VAVYGVAGEATTLQITSAGTVTLNGGDRNLAVQLAAGDTMALPFNTSIKVQGGGDDTLVATNGILRSGQTIAPGGGTNTLLLQGAGLFDLRAPAVLSNIQTLDVTGASAGQPQVVFLRDGLDLTLNVQDSAGVTVLGAANNDIINLGSGNAVVYLGGLGEVVNAGSGNDTFVGTAATIGGTIGGSPGNNNLKVQNGGTVAMGSGITGVQLVFLDNAASYDFTANAIAGLVIHAGTGTDTIVAGAGSQRVFGSTGTLTVQATTAQVGVAVYGSAGRDTTLAITTGGTVALNAGDVNLTIQLAAADTLALPFNTSIKVQGGGGDDTLVATDGILRANQTIAPGGGTNTLRLQGAGLFDLRAPAELSNIQTVDLAGASAGQSQVVFLRDGLDATVNVQDTATVTIFGAVNDDTINLGAGNANVYVDVGETVKGSTGNGTFFIAAISDSPTITSGSGSNVLHVLEGGTVVMGSNITGMSQVFLDNSASYDFTANATAGLTLFAGTGNDTITVGAASQKVVGSTGPLTVKATAAEAGIVIRSGTGAKTLELTTGGTAVLNANDTNLTVKLDASTNLGLGGLGFITAIGAAAGHDTITAGGTNQTLESTGGNDTLVGSSKFGDTFLGSSTGLAGDLIKGFGGSDVIDITDMVSGSVKPYVFNAGQLTVTDGSHSVTLAFSGGSYTQGSFAAPVSDGHGGTLIKFV
jgi:Ca2+-binding RTX toxin-like protein